MDINEVALIMKSETHRAFATTDVDVGGDDEPGKITLAEIPPAAAEIRFTTSGDLPAPLVAGRSYFAIRMESADIRVAATDIRVAETIYNAIHGIAIDLTTVGSGTHTIHERNVMDLTAKMPPEEKQHMVGEIMKSPTVPNLTVQGHWLRDAKSITVTFDAPAI